MATAVSAAPPKAAISTLNSSVTLRSSSTSSAKPTSLAATNPELYLQKLFNGDETKVKAALKIRRWLKMALLEKRKQQISAQLASLQAQHDLILTNPQHFQDVEIESLLQMAPNAFTSSSQSADPYRSMTEATDALLRSEIRRYTTFATSIRDTPGLQDFKQQITNIEAGRREILQTYAQRVRLMSSKPSNSAKKTSTPSQAENVENVPVSTQGKKTKLKKSASIRWADGNGQPLISAQVFEIDQIVAPSIATATQ